MSTTDPRTTRAESPTRLTRRTLTLGAAWTAPLLAVSVAAPAYAASCVASYQLRWGTTTYNRAANGSSGTATVTPTSGTATAVTVGFVSTMFGTTVRDNDNLSLETDSNIGGLGAGRRSVQLAHKDPIPQGRDNRQELTINFGRAVTGLSFTISDIDSSNGEGNNDWYDRVELSGTRNYASAPHVLGQGTQASPWLYDDNDTNVNITAGGGNVTVTYPGAVTSITLTYWSTARGSNQRIFLGDFTFGAACA